MLNQGADRLEARREGREGGGREFRQAGQGHRADGLPAFLETPHRLRDLPEPSRGVGLAHREGTEDGGDLISEGAVRFGAPDADGNEDPQLRRRLLPPEKELPERPGHDGEDDVVHRPAERGANPLHVGEVDREHLPAASGARPSG